MKLVFLMFKQVNYLDSQIWFGVQWKTYNFFLACQVIGQNLLRKLLKISLFYILVSLESVSDVFENQ